MSPGNFGSGPRRQLPVGRYVGPTLKGVEPTAWADLPALLEGRALDLVSVFTDPPITRVVVGLGPLADHTDVPGAIAVVLDCADNVMAVSATPGGFDALRHLDYNVDLTTPDVVDGLLFGRPRVPAFTVADEDSDRALDIDDFSAVVRRRIPRSAVLTRLRIARDEEHERLTAIFVFRDTAESMVALRVRPDGGSAWLDLRGVTLDDLLDEAFGDSPER